MISDDIKQGIPPAVYMPISLETLEQAFIANLWDVLNSCWNPLPEGRPSTQKLQEFVTNHELDLVAARKEDTN
jgi:hypothetical protein